MGRMGQVSTRLVNIGFFGGCHGAFLRYFIDRFSKHTPNIDSDPFMHNGTSHVPGIKYSQRIKRYTFEDLMGQPVNNYDLVNKGEKQIIIKTDQRSIFYLTRLYFTRESDHELVSTPIYDHGPEKGVLVCDNFKAYYGSKFEQLYKIDLQTNKFVPHAIMRDFCKMQFVNIQSNPWLVKMDKVLSNIDENTMLISHTDLYNTDRFIQQMKIISDKLELELDLGPKAIEVHKTFLSNRKNHDTFDRVFDVIKAIQTRNNISCEDLDLIEQGYISAWIERRHDFIQSPFSRDFFKDTNEINEYIDCFPEHYKAMNPNLKIFNGKPNPFYVWSKK